MQHRTRFSSTQSPVSLMADLNLAQLFAQGPGGLQPLAVLVLVHLLSPLLHHTRHLNGRVLRMHHWIGDHGRRGREADRASGMHGIQAAMAGSIDRNRDLSLIHISEPTRLLSISYAVFCLKKKKKRYTTPINRDESKKYPNKI
eukprot:TRINITY_DN17251_c0_g1_i5.p1 TRINITY_DN17251_c0_g1~~TRINITY_DN17251_c0_g1_i5.p1  ORF type:complete len:144 (+),score=11.13 TRINITY_DN17251_c0_g1_i5:524-955(+)